MILSVCSSWKINAQSIEATSPSVVVDALGNAVSIWQFAKGGSSIIQSASLSAGGSWSSPISLSGSFTQGYQPQMASNVNGDIVVAWTDMDPVTENPIITANIYSALGASWGGPVMVSTAGEMASADFSVSLNEEGDIIIVWDSFMIYGHQQYVRSSTGSVQTGVWSAPIQLSGS
jgi:hypothetical protein